MEIQTILRDQSVAIGASECASLLNVEPYGCTRQLVYRKRKVQPDFQRPETRDMIRGQKLETIALQEYKEQTKRKVITPTKGYFYPGGGLVAHPDGIIIDPKGNGVLDLKCPNTFSFARIKHYGYPMAWVLQIQQQMLCTGYKWGSLAAFNSDLWEMLPPFDMEYDPDLAKQIISASRRIWKIIRDLDADLPERLPIDDKRCTRCEYRNQCQGQFLLDLKEEQASEPLERDDSFEDTVLEYLEANSALRECQELVDGLKKDLIEKVGDRTKVDTSLARIAYPIITRNGIDSAKLKKKYPEIADECAKPTTYRSLRVTQKLGVLK